MKGIILLTPDLLMRAPSQRGNYWLVQAIRTVSSLLRVIVQEVYTRDPFTLLPGIKILTEVCRGPTCGGINGVNLVLQARLHDLDYS